MILKIVTLFLVGMGVLAMFGKLRMPKIQAYESRKCQKCGTFKIGKSPCLCEKNKS